MKSTVDRLIQLARVMADACLSDATFMQDNSKTYYLPNAEDKLRKAIEEALTPVVRDAKRFEWWFSDKSKSPDFIPKYLEGVRGSWTLDMWRAAIDIEMEKLTT